MTNELLHLAALHDITDGRLSLTTIIERAGDSISAYKHFSSLCKHGPTLQKYKDFAMANFERKLAKWEDALSLRLLSYWSKDYPEALRLLAQPPALLYLRGALPQGHTAHIAVVGSRSVSDYGRHAIAVLLPPILKRGIGIISGAALGIDTLAHKEALRCEQYTLALLGCGIAKNYPPSNKQLTIDIINAGGGVLSEFPLEHPPFAHNFPRRNRLIAAFAALTLVIEAAEKSGSLSTAYWAVNLGKDVHAVPRSILDTEKQGTNTLIQHGAKLVRCADDVIEGLGFQIVAANGNVKRMQQTEAVQTPQLTNEQAILLNTLDPYDPKHIDLLEVETGIPLEALQVLLLQCELAGLARAVRGGTYVRGAG